MTTPAERKHTEVAVGVLIRESDGALLITSRPEGKPRAGWWEFPGGKLEAGETVEQALRRELQEELGITITNCLPWKVTEHAYSHALVRLHWCKITQWEGEFAMLEGQQMAWQQLPLQVQPVLEARCRCCSGSAKSAACRLMPGCMRWKNCRNKSCQR